MKKMITTVMLAGVLLVSQSFTFNPANKNDAAYQFTIDGAPFDAMAANNYTAELMNGGRTASLIFIGNSLRGKNGEMYPTRIRIDYTTRGDELGEVNVERVMYEYNNQKYDGIPGAAFVSITKTKRSADGKSFIMSADIFCKVQKQYIMEEFVPVFAIRGSVQNITVNSPAL